MANSADPDPGSAPADVRAGRAALLDLLADLLLRELDEPLARRLAADPTLGAYLQPPDGEQALGALRSEYARLFLLEAPPYGSVYLDAPPLLGGESTARWEVTLARLGYASSAIERAAAPDHAGVALHALAWAERPRDTVGMVGVGTHDARAGVLAAVLRWLPQYLTTLEFQAGDAVYGRVAEMVGAVVQSCARDVTPLEPLASLEPAAVMHAPPADDDLRSLTRWLATPVQSGWYLSKERIRQLARGLGVGTGMVERERMLEQVFEASGLDNRTAELLDVLLQEWDVWSQALVSWTAALGPWESVLTSWRAALDQCHAILTAMREEVSRDA